MVSRVSVRGQTTVPVLRRDAMALASAGAAAIHFAVLHEHFREYWLFGVFFGVVAWLQMLWVILVVGRPSRQVLAVGALVNAAVVLVWVASRTIGLPLGPEPGEREAIAFPDALATGLELIIVFYASALLLDVRRPQRATPGGAPLLAGRLVLALAIMALTTASLALAGGHEEPGGSAHQDAHTRHQG